MSELEALLQSSVNCSSCKQTHHLQHFIWRMSKEILLCKFYIYILWNEIITKKMFWKHHIKTYYFSCCKWHHHQAPHTTQDNTATWRFYPLLGWFKNNLHLKTNDLVLVKEENQPLLKWQLGRRIELFIGDDNHVRAMKISSIWKIWEEHTSKSAHSFL